MSSNSGNRENIKVICRLRPLYQRELDSGCGVCITSTPNSLKINIDLGADKSDGISDFTFDRVFEPDIQQHEVFDYVAKPIIEGALEGWNGTLFCYGQTSSGKTHTMEGKHDDLELRGIIPRMMEYVFQLINNASTDLEFTVKCSFLEIYNEKIQDLLDPRKNNLMVKEEKSKGIWVDDATEIYVLSKEEMYDVFKIGSDNRKVAATNMNAKSSRSHSVFIVTIFQKNNRTDSTKTGKIYFVDLAGSEKMSKTGIEGGQMLEEAKNINKSLLNLGMVINALTEGRPHVPYRDSKLTRVLQESLGGNSHTTLIINCSMSSYNDKESLSTLRFGQRAKAIKNKVINNTDRSAKELLLKLNEAEEKIKYYQNIITQMQSGGDSSVVNNANLLNIVNVNNKTSQNSNANATTKSKACEDCSNAMRKLLNQHIEMVTMQDELEKARQDKQELEEEITSRNNELYDLNERALLSELKAKLFIEEELKTFQELQIQLEHIFLLNQNKLLEINKIRNIIEKTRYEIIILIKSNKLKLDKTQLEASTVEFRKFNKNLEDSLEVLNRIEEYIMTDNKNFTDLVDFISGKNSDNDNLPSGNSYLNFNRRSGSTINNINLNINKNININIIEEAAVKKKRRNSFSFCRRRRNTGDITSCSNTVIKNQRGVSTNAMDVSSISENIKMIKKLPLLDEEILNCSAEKEKEKEFMESKAKNNSSNDSDFNLILQQQRKTISDLAFHFKSVKDTLSNVKKENEEKDLILNKNNENIVKTEMKIKEYEEIINELNEKIIRKEEDFDIYKTQTMIDFEYKEKKIVELINKVSDLEDENYKILHFNKDKDKKKYIMVDKQVKELTKEMQKLIAENGRLRAGLEKKDEEMKNVYGKVSDLENRLVQSVRHKMNEISFAGNGPDLQSGICTPITSYLNAKGFQCSTMSDILTAKLRNLKSISPKSGDSINTSVFKVPEFNSSKKLYHVNVNNIPNTIPDNNNSPINTNSPNNNLNAPNKIMRVIRGGGGKNYKDNNQNAFFSKLLNTANNQDNPLKFQTDIKKINLDKFRQDKYEQEMKYLDNDDLNISRESELMDIQPMETKRAKTPQKERGGFFNFFSKIIK